MLKSYWLKNYYLGKPFYRENSMKCYNVLHSIVFCKFNNSGNMNKYKPGWNKEKTQKQKILQMPESCFYSRHISFFLVPEIQIRLQQ